MPASSRDASETEFLNVDLDLRLDRDLGLLVASFGEGVIVLHSKGDWARLRLNSARRLSLEQTLSSLVEAVEALPPAARRLWDRCQERRLDIGVRAGLVPYAAPFLLPFRLVARLAACKADLALTVYAPDRNGLRGD